MPLWIRGPGCVARGVSVSVGGWDGRDDDGRAGGGLFEAAVDDVGRRNDSGKLGKWTSRTGEAEEEKGK